MKIIYMKLPCRKRLSILSIKIIPLIVSLSFNSVTAQIFDTKGDIAAPETSSPFMKDIHNGVNIQTGTANFTYKLFSLKVDEGFEIPIEISYNTNGIKINQSPGEIGLGWDFSANYRITRTVYCRPDEHYPRPSSQDLLNIVNQWSTPVSRDQDLTQFTFGLATNGGLRLRSNQTIKDSEYDIFDYHTPFFSGSFIIEDVETKKITASEDKLIKFDFDKTTNDGIRSFSMQDVEGNKSSFGFDPSSANYYSDFIYAWQGKKTSLAWPVMNISTPNNRTVRFAYTLKDLAEGLSLPAERALSFVEPVISLDNSGSPTATQVNDINDGTSGARRTYLTSTITSDFGIVKIFRGVYEEIIDSIVLYDANLNRVKSVSFVRSYSSGYNFMDAVIIKGVNAAITEKCSFTYAQRNITNLVPDIWNNLSTPSGGSQFSSIEFKYPSPLGNATVFDPSKSQVTGLPITAYFPSAFADRTPLYKPDYYSLQKVTLPTGGTITYEYQPNLYHSHSSTTNIQLGPGIRVFKVYMYDPISDKTLTTTYNYGHNNEGAGDIPVEITPQMFALDQVSLIADIDNSTSTNTLLRPVRNRTFSNCVMADNDPYFARYNVISYTEVTESTGTGYIKYFFDDRAAGVWRNGCSPIGCQVNNTFYLPLINNYITREFQPGFFYEYNMWDKPTLRRKEIYDVSGNMKRMEEFDYGKWRAKSYMGLKVKLFASMPYSFNPESNYSYPEITSLYDYTTYNINFASNLLDYKRIINFENNTPISILTSYTYNELDQLISETETRSDQKSKQVDYTYANATVLLGLTNTDPLSLDVVKMQQKNIVAPWVERKTSISNSLVSSEFMPMFSGSNKPRTMYFQNLPNNFVPVSNSNGKVNIDAQYQKSLMEILAVDAVGNPVMIKSNDGLVTSFIYGYGSLYPVAQVTGADLSTVSGLVNQTVLDYPLSTEAQIQAQLNNLRSGLAGSKALVTTYTYSPLVGMTSQTDPTGKTTYYEYDGFARLDNIRDQDRNVLKRYQYGYGSTAAKSALTSNYDLSYVLRDFRNIRSGSMLQRFAYSDNTGTHYLQDPRDFYRDGVAKLPERLRTQLPNWYSAIDLRMDAPGFNPAAPRFCFMKQGYSVEYRMKLPPTSSNINQGGQYFYYVSANFNFSAVFADRYNAGSDNGTYLVGYKDPEGNVGGVHFTSEGGPNLFYDKKISSDHLFNDFHNVKLKVDATGYFIYFDGVEIFHQATLKADIGDVIDDHILVSAAMLGNDGAVDFVKITDKDGADQYVENFDSPTSPAKIKFPLTAICPAQTDCKEAFRVYFNQTTNSNYATFEQIAQLYMDSYGELLNVCN